MAVAQSVAPKLAKLKQAAQGMEAHFVKDMLEAMQKGLNDNKPGEDFGSDEYQDMFNDAVSNAMSKKTGLGIAETVYKSLEPAAFQEERVLLAAKASAKAKGATGGKL